LKDIWTFLLEAALNTSSRREPELELMKWEKSSNTWNRMHAQLYSRLKSNQTDIHLTPREMPEAGRLGHCGLDEKIWLKMLV
jgi:hypothetical protein